MQSHKSETVDAIVFAIDRDLLNVGERICRLLRAADSFDHDQWLLRSINSAGEVLKLVYRHEPRVLLACLGEIKLHEAATLIEIVRSRRPELSLLAVVAMHDPNIEQRAREAGASGYFPLGSDLEEQRLLQALSAFVPSDVPHSSHCGLSPPPPQKVRADTEPIISVSTFTKSFKRTQGEPT